MKSIYGILLLAMICFGMNMRVDKITIHGKITDTTGEELIGANVLVKGTGIATATDIDGNYDLKVSSLPVEVVISYTGFSPKLVKVKSRDGNKVEVNVVLEEAMILDEVVVSGYSAKRTRRSSASKASRRAKKASTARSAYEPSSFSYSEERIESPATVKDAEHSFSGAIIEFAEDAAPMAMTYASSSETIGFASMDKDMSAKNIATAMKYKLDASTMLLDGKVVSKNLIPMAELNPLEAIAMDNKLKEELLKKRTEKKDPKAGQLTAGEWNDLNNWSEWEDLKEDKEFKIAADDWQMNMFDRYSFLLENENGQPLADAVVELLDEQNVVVWKTRTDNVGKAELYANVFSQKEGNGKVQIKGNYDGQIFSIKKAKRYSEKGLKSGRINKVKISAECNVSDQLDIMMVVDATASMKDEIKYLKSELKDVISRVQNTNDDLYIRLGSVFYRDHGDSYLTKQTPLSDDIQQTIDFIHKQRAGGGGDTPEAVDVALMEAIEKQDWSDEAVARIVFLVLDASPHKQEENLKSLEKTILQAAEKGIKIIPIAASGIRKETEYLMKFMAAATNGTYVFITDDSGIGNSHLKPTASKYDVELLNDLMVRLIKKYTDRTKCDEQQNEMMAFQNDPLNQSSTVTFPTDDKLLSKVKYFPNPAISNITLQLQDDFTSITIVNSNGQEVLRLENVQAGQREVDVSNLSEGFYLIRFKKDKTVASGKLVIIRP